MKSMSENRKKMVVGGFIAFIMIASIFVVTLDYVFSPAQGLTYNNVKFTPGSNQFFAKINGKDYSFLVYPADLEYIDVPAHAKELLTAQVLTVTYDPQSQVAESLATAQYYLEEQLQGVRIIDRAVLNNTGLALEQKSCANATTSQPVIELREGDNSSIRVEGDCISIIAFDSPDLLRMAERIAYQILGVMQ